MSKYTDEVTDQICRRLAEGESLRSICRDEHMPAASTVLAWAKDTDSLFAEQYARAREVGYHALADEILDIADDGTNDFVERKNKDGSTSVVFDAEQVQRSKLRVDARKWLLSKMLPKQYGDKVAVGGDGESPIIVEIVRFGCSSREEDESDASVGTE